jgi:hypothetical protein
MFPKMQNHSNLPFCIEPPAMRSRRVRGAEHSTAIRRDIHISRYLSRHVSRYVSRHVSNMRAIVICAATSVALPGCGVFCGAGGGSGGAFAAGCATGMRF